MVRRIAVGLCILAVVGCAAAALSGPVMRMFRPVAGLEPIYRQARERNWQAVESRARSFLRDEPDSVQARELLAHAYLNRREPDPAAALQVLDAVREVPTRERATYLVTRGEALYRLHRAPEAESAWLEALKLDPGVPEATWLLMQLYYIEGRETESAALALQRFRVETDRRDRVGLMLELAREDGDRLAAAGLIRDLEPYYRATPDDHHVAIAYGRALAKDGIADRGIPILRKVIERHPSSIQAWEALLGGLADQGEPEELATAFESVPRGIRDDPRLAAYRGKIAQDRGERDAAVAAYRRAVEANPSDARLLFRLSRALRLAGKADEERAVIAREEEVTAAGKELKELVRQARALPDLGLRPRPELYERFAVLRERMGRPQEAAAWRELASEGKAPTTARIKH